VGSVGTGAVASCCSIQLLSCCLPLMVDLRLWAAARRVGWCDELVGV
jgi:hypothetical protein